MNTAGTALSWEELNPADLNNSKYFMAALNDVLASMKAGPGYFSEVFCNVLFANSASISALQTQTIRLSKGGMIKSNDETYEEHKTGMCIRADGRADFNGDTHIGGIFTVDGKADLLGTVFIGGDAIFSGNIESGPLVLNDFKPDAYSYTSQELKKIGEHWYDRIIGVYNDINFSYLTKTTQSDAYGRYKISIKLYDENKKNIYSYDSEWGKEPLLPHPITITYIMNTGSKTFKLINLPTTKPSGAGYVWNDSGTLKIT